MRHAIAAIGRGLKGALWGAVMTGLLAVGTVGAFSILHLEIAELHPVDRDRDVQRLPRHLKYSTIVGAIVGGLAGFVSRLSRRGYSFSRALVIIAVFAAVTRFFTHPQGKRIIEELPWHERHSYELTTAAACLGALIVLLLAAKRETAEEPV